MTTNPELANVPEDVFLWIRLFPECYDRARWQHRVTESGTCYSCYGVRYPCKFERWLTLIPRPKLH